MQIFDVNVFFKLQTIQQKTVKPTYLTTFRRRQCRSFALNTWCRKNFWRDLQKPQKNFWRYLQKPRKSSLLSSDFRNVKSTNAEGGNFTSMKVKLKQPQSLKMKEDL